MVSLDKITRSKNQNTLKSSNKNEYQIILFGSEKLQLDYKLANVALLFLEMKYLDLQQ